MPILSENSDKMASFYQNWLRKNNEENRRALNRIKQPVVQLQVSDLPMDVDSTNVTPSTLQGADLPIASTSSAPSTFVNQVASTSKDIQPQSVSDIVYEKDGLQLLVERGMFQRQKKFSLQDHLFYIKIRQVDENKRSPLLRDLLTFLEIGFKHVLQSVSKFYNKDDHNVAFLALFQTPMITALNSGH